MTQPTRTQHYHFARTDARMRLFKEVYLFDPAIAVEAISRSGCYMGAIRLGMPAYHAELSIEMKGSQPKRIISRFVSGFFPAPNKSRYFKLMEAIGLYKLKRDNTLVNTKNFASVKASRRILSGQCMSGEFVRIRA